MWLYIINYIKLLYFICLGSDILGHPMIVEPSHQQRLSSRYIIVYTGAYYHDTYHVSKPPIINLSADIKGGKEQ